MHEEYWNRNAARRQQRVKMNDLDRQIEQLCRCETLKESEVKALCQKAREILIEESNVQKVNSPVTVRVIRLIVINFC